MVDPDPVFDAYLVWSHEHGAWWAPGWQGYTKRLHEAGAFSHAEALAICRAAVPQAMHHGALCELPVRLADVLLMLRHADGTEYERGVPRGLQPWE